MRKTYRIGELAAALSVPIETIRYYEKEKLLPRPARSEGNYRLYTDPERLRLRLILNCRALDMTLDEIRQLLDLRDRPEQACAEVNDIIDAHMQHVADRLLALRDLQAELKAIRSRCSAAESGDHCGILDALSNGVPEHRGKTSVGVHSRKRGT